ncbi:MAG: hypothetical protein E4H28_07165 [Gemmatimonadales bacterium]|nr:MAG: hypothetical protein E4H28_07165 [Gemmatimonadales bacterium]
MSGVDTRIQLHWAVQLLARFGDAHVEARPDYSHSALTWNPESRRFRTQPDPSGRRLKIDLAGLVYRMSGPGDASTEFSLRGHTLDEAFAWLASLPGEQARLELGEPDIPPHPVSTGAAFDPDPEDAAKLATRFHDAHLALTELRAARPTASPVRCWPHHFDIAVLIMLDAPDIEPDPETARSVGVGMTPGDTTYVEPYWYVTPWPYPADPDVSALPALPSGAGWHTEGWIGAVLGGEAAVQAGADGVARYLKSAVDACAGLAGI